MLLASVQCQPSLLCWNPEREKLESPGFGVGEGAVGPSGGGGGGAGTCCVFDGESLPLPSPSLLNDTGLGVVLRPIRPGLSEECYLTHPSCCSQRRAHISLGHCITWECFSESKPQAWENEEGSSLSCVFYSWPFTPLLIRYHLGGSSNSYELFGLRS